MLLHIVYTHIYIYAWPIIYLYTQYKCAHICSIYTSIQSHIL